MIIGTQFDYMRPHIITTTNTEVKTMDELVEYIMSRFKLNVSERAGADDACKFLISCHPQEVLDMLLSPENVPSKYDLNIIKYLSKGRQLPTEKLILKAYNDRKV